MLRFRTEMHMGGDGVKEFFDSVQELEHEAARMVESAVREARSKVESAERQFDEELNALRERKQEELKSLLLREEESLRKESLREVEEYAGVAKNAAAELERILCQMVGSIVKRYLGGD